MVSPSLRPRRTVSFSVRSTSFVVASSARTPPIEIWGSSSASSTSRCSATMPHSGTSMPSR
ncbi:protein MRG1-like [Iris pallida]|uniref:Protein MRG1-like n=1 Tax=Iris pallida TaxID=29817 RepID=A0AAX6IC77_IRIPA|nr:protein MRG1-like [Iris pallida]